jgi:hypothetical protein
VYENLPPALFYGAVLLCIFALLAGSIFGANLLALSGLVLMACSWQILAMRTKHREDSFQIRRLFLFVPVRPELETPVPERNEDLLKAFGIDGLVVLDDSRQ